MGTMAVMEWTLEILLVVLLGATLLQAVRLERALGVLKRDRSSLEALVARFNASTQLAETGIQRLRAAAEGAGHDIDGQLTKSRSLKDDLVFLTERGDRLADRLDGLVRTARPLIRERPTHSDPPPRQPARETEVAMPEGVSQIERNLLMALRMAR